MTPTRLVFVVGLIAAGGLSASSASPSAAAAPRSAPVPVAVFVANTATFGALEDAYVGADQPAANHGGGVQLISDATPIKQSFVKFGVSGVTGPVLSAKLRLHVKDLSYAGGPTGGAVSVTSTDWGERTVNYNNRPAVGAQLATLGPVARNTWYEIDVAAAVNGNGLFAFALTNTNGDAAIYDSRETGALGPKLVVTSDEPDPGADPVLVGAGDISTCAGVGDEKTAALLDNIPGTVFTGGDNAYNDGSAAQYANCYHPTWGRHKARTRPVPGNHEYRTANAAGYFGYFGAAAGDPAKGYYSFDLGEWHVIVINSNCSFIGGCHAGSPQETWLRADLAASAKLCTAAIWHHPLFTSGANHGPATFMRPIYQALYDANADLVVAGHNHNYERFAPQNPTGVLDPARGLRQFVAGMGGNGHYQFATTIRPNSEARNADTWGVLKLTLRPAGYDFAFVPEAGKTYTDSGTGTCH